MYIIRDIFQLQFGHYKDVKVLLDEAIANRLFPDAQEMRILTDFTGDSYRLILEEGYKTLADYEKSLTEGMASPEWKAWYEKFKSHIYASHREILKKLPL